MKEETAVSDGTETRIIADGSIVPRGPPQDGGGDHGRTFDYTIQTGAAGRVLGLDGGKALR